MYKILKFTLPLLALSVLSGCFTIRTEHEVKPIHITVDVNLKVQRELDDVFSDLDAASETLQAPDPDANGNP